MLSFLTISLIFQSDSLKLLLTRLSWLRTATHSSHHLTIFYSSSFSGSTTLIGVSRTHLYIGFTAVFGRLLLAQRLLTLESGSNWLHWVLKIWRRRIFNVSRKWLVFWLEFLVLSAFWSMHHTFDVEHIGKILVGIERRINWLQGLNRARWTNVFAFSRKTFGLGLVNISDVDVRPIIAKIIWPQSPSAHIFRESRIWLTWFQLFIISSVVEVLTTTTVGIPLGEILCSTILVRILWMRTPVHVDWLFPNIGRLFWSLLLDGFYLLWLSSFVYRFRQFWRIDSKLLLVFLFKPISLLLKFIELWLNHLLLLYLLFQS